MKERFAAGGSRGLWIKSSEEALEAAGFKDIHSEDFGSTISAEKDGPISIHIESLPDNKVALNIESDSTENINSYKNEVAKAFQLLQRKQAQELEEARNRGDVEEKEDNSEPLGGLPESYKPSEENRFQPAFPEETTTPTEKALPAPKEAEPAPPEEEVKEEKPISDTAAILPGWQNNSERPLTETRIGSGQKTPAEYVSNLLEVDHPSQEEGTQSSSGESEAIVPHKAWYESDWFTLLMLLLIPPLGIFLMWNNKVFKDNLRKGLTVFFCLYTLLWGWLIFTTIFPQNQRNQIEDINQTQIEENNNTTPVNSSGSAITALQNYWNNTNVVDYMANMPAQISAFDNLVVNGILGTPDGNAQASQIFAQVQALNANVLSVPAVPTDSAAFPLQQKVTEAANMFNQACAEGQSAIDAQNYDAQMAAVNTWTAAENLFYEISYTYNQSMSAAANALQSGGNTGQSTTDTTQQTPNQGVTPDNTTQTTPVETTPTETTPTETTPVEVTPTESVPDETVVVPEETPTDTEVIPEEVPSEETIVEEETPEGEVTEETVEGEEVTE